MGGNGKVLAAYDGATCPIEWTMKWNFNQEAINNIIPFNLSFINPEGKGLNEPSFVVLDDGDNEGNEEMDEERKAQRQNRLKLRREKRELVKSSLLSKTDSLIIACKYSPLLLVKALLPFLKPSCPLVIYSDTIEVSFG